MTSVDLLVLDTSGLLAFRRSHIVRTMRCHAGRFTVFLAHTLFAVLCLPASGCAHQDQNMPPPPRP